MIIIFIDIEVNLDILNNYGNSKSQIANNNNINNYIIFIDLNFKLHKGI